jgi:bacteriochlorophyllide a dehydrogenase
MDAVAVILEAPEQLSLRPLALNAPNASDIVVDIAWSGISTGTEKLLWSGKMPEFPGMGYPLVPGYESVGRVVDAGADARSRIGEWVFVPGANCYESARGLFGGTASRVVLPGARAVPVPESLGVSGVLVALAATAHHAISGHTAPDLIVGHGVLGRLLARVSIALGSPAPVVWETNSLRRRGGMGYPVALPGATIAQSMTPAAMARASTISCCGWRRAARLSSRASMTSRCNSLSRLLSCVKRASGSPPNLRPPI